jgi:hypothetical protein
MPDRPHVTPVEGTRLEDVIRRIAQRNSELRDKIFERAERFSKKTREALDSGSFENELEDNDAAEDEETADGGRR